MKLTLLAATALFATTMNLAQAETLTLDVYNPGNNSVFPVSSEIISGSSEVVLIDAQFQKMMHNNWLIRLKNSIKINHDLH